MEALNKFLLSGAAVSCLLLIGCNSETTTDISTNTSTTSSYALLDTGQANCYDNGGAIITSLAEGEVFYGQDAQYEGNQFSFFDNGDGTVMYNATGLMWQQADSGSGMNWEDALTYAGNATTGGYDDWRLHNTKELQSIVDYTKLPSASDAENQGPAIDTDFFEITELAPGTTNYDPDYGYFCSSTSAYFGGSSLEYYYAWYVAFGTAVDDTGADFHGAGGMRFDTKYEGGNLSEVGERYYNYVRLVRDAE